MHLVVADVARTELRAYLKESLFMSFNRYENEQLLDAGAPGESGGGTRKTRRRSTGRARERGCAGAGSISADGSSTSCQASR